MLWWREWTGCVLAGVACIGCLVLGAVYGRLTTKLEMRAWGSMQTAALAEAVVDRLEAEGDAGAVASDLRALLSEYRVGYEAQDIEDLLDEYMSRAAGPG